MDPILFRRAGITLALSGWLTASLFAQDATTESTPSTPSTTSTTSTPGTTDTTPVPPPSPAPGEGAFLPEVTPLDEAIAVARGTLSVEDGGFFAGEELVLEEEDGTTVKIDIHDDLKVAELRKLEGRKIEIRGQFEDADKPESHLKSLVAYRVLSAEAPAETASQPVIPANEVAAAPTAPRMEIPTASDAGADSAISPGTPTSADDPQPPETPLTIGGADNPAQPPPPPIIPGATTQTQPAPVTLPAQQTIIGRVMKPLTEDKVTQKVGLATEEGDKYLIVSTGRGADLEGLLGAKVRVIGKVLETAQLQQPPQPAVVQDEPITEQVAGDHAEKTDALTGITAVPPVKDVGPTATSPAATSTDEVGTGAEPPAPPRTSTPEERGIPAGFHLSFKDAKTLEVESLQVLEMAQGNDGEVPAVPLDTGLIDHLDQPESDVQPETSRQTLDERERTGI